MLGSQCPRGGEKERSRAVEQDKRDGVLGQELRDHEYDRAVRKSHGKRTPGLKVREHA